MVFIRWWNGDATVTDLAAPYDISLQAVSKHLKVLGEAGVELERTQVRFGFNVRPSVALAIRSKRRSGIDSSPVASARPGNPKAVEVGGRTHLPPPSRVAANHGPGPSPLA